MTRLRKVLLVIESDAREGEICFCRLYRGSSAICNVGAATLVSGRDSAPHTLENTSQHLRNALCIARHARV